MKPFRIRVPASTANIGPGFDSLGLALALYLTVDVSPSSKWRVEQHSPHLSADANAEDNYILQIARETAGQFHKELPACKLVVSSEVPLARGLGSSASAIVAGIELADQLCSLSLTPEQKLELGNDIEGHPDNIAPALYGGLIITTAAAGRVDWIRMPGLDTDVVMSIPRQDLKTEASRKALPDMFSRERAAAASSVSNVLVAALLSGDYRLAGKMMESDLFHEPYRAHLIPHYNDIKLYAAEQGAYGTVISGAGPAMISFLPKGKGKACADQLKTELPDYQIERLSVDRTGLHVTQSSTSKERTSE